MNLKSFLSDHKKVILEKWFDLVIDSYPADGSNFLRNETNRFQNPVGYTISKDLEIVFDNLVERADYQRLCDGFENIAKIRYYVNKNIHQCSGNKGDGLRKSNYSLKNSKSRVATLCVPAGGQRSHADRGNEVEPLPIPSLYR